MTDIAKLKALAEAADQSEWGVVVSGSPASNPAGAALLIGPRRIDMDRMAGFNADDARFIAAANPVAVLELIAEIERLRDSHEQICANYNKVSFASEERGKQIDQLKAENEALVTALNDILRVTPMSVEAFGIAALVLGELGVSKEASHD
jgi:hypothetical protein